MGKKRKGWPPASRPEKYEMVTGRVIPYIGENRARFGMTDSSRSGKWYDEEFIAKAYNPFAKAYAAWMNPVTRTRLAVRAAAEAEKVFVSRWRALYRLLKTIQAVTDIDLLMMGFPKRSGVKPGAVPVATEAPSFEASPLSGCRVQVIYRPHIYRRGNKPPGQQGAEVRWGFSETPVANPGLLHNFVIDEASPCILEFSEHRAGRTVCIALRWVNKHGKEGPWSEVKRVKVAE
jgi:hypothetical protein